jgi:protein-tyrosine phosphatase
MDALSTLNFRDVGGIAVRGGVLRQGVLYRCEGPAKFDDAQRAALRALGLRVICDLRSTPEIRSAPNDWVEGARLMNLDIVADLRAQSNSAWAVMRDSPSAEGARRTMAINYRAMPQAFARHLPAFVDAFIGGDTPMLVHCTAGKDRTGVLVALLLQLLGADDEDIRRDYLLSECFGKRPGNGDSIRARFQSTLGYPPDDETMKAMLGVDAAYLDAMSDEVATRWGSVEAYFAACGVDDARREALEEVLVSVT